MTVNGTLLPIQLSEIQHYNDSFSLATVRVMNTGMSLHNTVFSMEAIQNALPSIVGVPIVGEFDYDEGDYLEHGKTSKEIQQTRSLDWTRPYGYVPHTASVEFVPIVNQDGEEEQQLVLKDVVLWTGRYPELEVLTENRFQSIEIKVNHSESINGVTYVRDFDFTGLCILGENYIPAMQGASIKLNSIGMDELEEMKMMFSAGKKDKEGSKLTTKKSKDGKEEVIEAEKATVEEETIKNNEKAQEEGKQEAPKATEVEEVVVTDVPAEQEAEKATDVVDTDKEQYADESKEEPAKEEEKAGDSEEVKALKEENAKLKEEVKTLKEGIKDLKAFKADAEEKDKQYSLGKVFKETGVTKEELEKEGYKVEDATVEQVETYCYAVLGKRARQVKDEETVEKTHYSFKTQTQTQTENKAEQRYPSLFSRK